MEPVFAAEPTPLVLPAQVLAQPVVPGAGLPIDMPPTDPAAPKLAVTPEQIAWLAQQAGALFPSLVKFWPQISAVLVLVAGLGATLGWWAAPPKPAPAPLAPWSSNVPLEKPPVTVIVHPPAPVPAPAPVPTPVPDPHPKPSPIVPPAAAGKLALMLYTTAAGQASVAADVELLHAVTVTVDPKLYAPGTGYRFGAAVVPMPCAVLSRDGAVVEVVPFTSGAELAALVSKHYPK